VENYILNVKHEHPSWGARKIRERLLRRFSGIPIPAKSTIHAVLDRSGLVERRGRICLGNKKINFSQVFAGQAVGIKEVHDDIWLVSFMDYDLGYLDLETRVLEPLENPFGPKVLPM
jgi:hypothetical protein